GAWKCKTALGGVHCYQDTKDKSSTTNLKHQQPVHYLHQTHKNLEPLCAGCPNIELPSPDVLSYNIKVAFEKCSEHI
ncbi:hypothetical protein EV424DRAFT_1300960, partial [Suillus variegatus]